MTLKKGFLFVLLIILCVSCSQIDIDNTKIPDIENLSNNLESSTSGMAGYIVDGNKNNPTSGEIVKLAKVLWNEDHTSGNFVIEGSSSPSTITLADGYFEFLNIVPGEYVIVVGDVNVNPIAIIDNEQEDKAKIFDLLEGEVLYVEYIDIAKSRKN